MKTTLYHSETVPPSHKECPTGYCRTENGFWTYSRRAARNPRVFGKNAGWMFVDMRKKPEPLYK
jgi:hypothetical protein